MTGRAEQQQKLIRREIQILSASTTGLLSTLALDSHTFTHQNPEPTFFLSSDLRTMIPNHSNSHIRIYYLALLKICFQRDSQSSQAVLYRFKQEICREDVNLDLGTVLPGTCRYSEYYSSNLIKKILLEWFMMLNCRNRSIMEYIGTYPILDTILQTALKTLVERFTHQPTRYLGPESIVLYFESTLGIRTINNEDSIDFDQYGLSLGAESWCLFLLDQYTKDLPPMLESRVDPYRSSETPQQDHLAILALMVKEPQRQRVQNQINKSWAIPQQSIYERLDEDDCLFSQSTPHQSRQSVGTRKMIFNQKGALTDPRSLCAIQQAPAVQLNYPKSQRHIENRAPNNQETQRSQPYYLGSQPGSKVTNNAPKFWDSTQEGRLELHSPIFRQWQD